MRGGTILEGLNMSKHGSILGASIEVPLFMETTI